MARKNQHQEDAVTLDGTAPADEIRPADDGTNPAPEQVDLVDQDPTAPEQVDLVDQPMTTPEEEEALRQIDQALGDWYDQDAAKVGDTIDLYASSGLVRLPDGTVVTCRGSYTARHTGDHVFFTKEDGETVETTVNVVAAVSHG